MTINYQGQGGGIPRKTAKIFAENALTDDVTVFGSTLAGSTVKSKDISLIQNNAYSSGWRNAVISNKNYPLLADMNAVLLTATQQIAGVLQHGICEYDSSTKYYTYDLVNQNGIIYISLQDNHSGHTPSNSSSYWAVFYDPDTFVAKAGDTMTGNLIISKNQPTVALINTTMEKGVTPSSELISYFRFYDKNSSSVANVGFHQYSNGSVANVLGVNNPSGSGSTYISIGYDENGNVYSYAPTPASGSNDTNIATTEFVVSGFAGLTSNNTLSGTNDFTGTITATTQSRSDNSTKVATTAYADNAGVPIGTIIWFSGSTPTGYLYCNGAAISRTNYAALFAVTDTKFGEGDGSTTFNLPELRNKYVRGGTPIGDTFASKLPNIKGKASAYEFTGFDNGSNFAADGAFSWTSDYNFGGNQNSDDTSATLTFDASRSSTVYDDSITEVQPPSVRLRPCIKYM